VTTIETRASRTGDRASPALRGLLGVLAFGGLLEVAPRLGVVPSEFAPPASRILGALRGQLDRPEFWVALNSSIRTWMTGLAIAVVAGIVIGVVLGAVPILREITASTIEFLRPIPSVALIPLVVLLYPPLRAITVLVVYAAFWQMLVQVLHGVADIDPVALDTARSYRLSRWKRIRYVVWPTVLPYAMTGLRLATAVALILTVTGEMVIGGSAGLGREISIAKESNLPAAMYALVVVAGLLGLIANLVTRTAERRLLRWHQSMRKEIPV